MKRLFFIIIIFLTILACNKTKDSTIEKSNDENTAKKLEVYENDIEEYDSTDSISQDSDE